MRAKALPMRLSSMIQTQNPISAALEAIGGRIVSAARAAGRDPGDIALTAVSKTQPWESVEQVVNLGQRIFGENRVQEAEDRWSGRRQGLELRLIGPLQTNKTREAVGFFDVIETVDRLRLAERIADAVQRLGRTPRLYVQVNTGDEPQKAGITPTESDAFIAACRSVHGLELEGLMCIPPEAEPPGPHFALLAKIAARNGIRKLSMGMSADFETAIRHGATSIRIGSALFGVRR
jgi:pyridoxal phosphate enzyme (YggS family)